MGKSNRKPLLVMLFALMLVLGTLAGCTSKKEVDSSSSGDSSSEEVSKVKVYKSHLGIGTLPGPDDPHVQKILEATGVQYELMSTPAGSDPIEYLNLMFASEDYPDIFRPIGGFEQTLISQGAALALDDLLPKYAPHVWERIPKEAWDVVRSATPDGKIY
jgi:ABC-type glycerol-3-phosphate transport system substrate-binding protein